MAIQAAAEPASTTDTPRQYSGSLGTKRVATLSSVPSTAEFNEWL
ncbi:hypothetical protein OHB54_42540 [Streptomyces sp. NBC_01007]|nr:hypothetical protein OHB54_42540 [Streptomyces sp. NBC_01007]